MATILAWEATSELRHRNYSQYSKEFDYSGKISSGDFRVFQQNRPSSVIQVDATDGLLFGQLRRWRFDLFGPQWVQNQTLARIGSWNDGFHQAPRQDSAVRTYAASHDRPVARPKKLPLITQKTVIHEST